MRHWGWPMPIHEKTVLAFQLLYPESGNIRSKRFNDYITAKIWFRPEIKVHKWYIQISDFLMFGKILIYPWDFRAWFIFLSFHRHRCGQSMWFSIVVPGNGSKKTTSPHGIGNNPRKSIEYCLNGKTMLWLIHWDNSTSIIHWERPIVSDWWHFSVSLVHILVVELHHPFVCRILPGAAGQIWYGELLELWRQGQTQHRLSSTRSKVARLWQVAPAVPRVAFESWEDGESRGKLWRCFQNSSRRFESDHCQFLHNPCNACLPMVIRQWKGG